MNIVDEKLPTAQDARQARQIIEENGTRSQLFYLEGILKLYRKRYAEIETHYQIVKRLEDLLGVAEQRRALVVKAMDSTLPAEAKAHLAIEAARSELELEAELSRHWLKDPKARAPALKSLAREVDGLKFDGYKKDRKYLKKELHRRLRDAAEREFDMTQLQGDVGLHELRRVLRWFPIYAVSLDGLVQLDAQHHPVARYAELTSAPVAKSTYARLPPSTREKAPMSISQSLFLANTQWIGNLGELKDSGEDIEGFQHALMATGVKDAHQAESRAMKILGVDEDSIGVIQSGAAKMLDEVVAQKVFAHFDESYE